MISEQELKRMSADKLRAKLSTFKGIIVGAGLIEFAVLVVAGVTKQFWLIALGVPVMSVPTIISVLSVGKIKKELAQRTKEKAGV